MGIYEIKWKNVYEGKFNHIYKYLEFSSFWDYIVYFTSLKIRFSGLLMYFIFPKKRYTEVKVFIDQINSLKFLNYNNNLGSSSHSRLDVITKKRDL